MMRRHSLRERLTKAFVIVSLSTIILAFIVIHVVSLWQEGVHPAWNFRLLLLALPIAAGAGALTARVISRRLSRLRDAVLRLDPRDLSQRVSVEGDDEVADLARAFNATLDRLELDERVRRQLFADVAHELRHPLAVLTGRLELMQDGVVPLDPEQLLHLQEMVLSLNRLVSDLRDLSLAEIGRLSLHFEEFDSGALILDLVENLEPVASAKEITLISELAPELPLISADGDRIRQVLVNLLSNALQYTPAHGRVTIRAAGEDGGVCISVTDTGPGIDPAEQPHLFDRFYRSDKARGRSSGGSGLGLAIVRSLVHLHGGSVSVESKLGVGSRFTIRLPIEKATVHR